jgi:hypothetical protein
MKINLWLAAGLATLFLAACANPTPAVLPSPAPTASAFPSPVPTVQIIASPSPVPTALPLYQQVTLTAETANETGKAPLYTFKTQTPILKGSSDPRVALFNAGVADLIKKATDQFHQDLASQPATPIAGGSYFDLSYERLSAPGSLISLQIKINGMSDGAAHPYRVILSYNFDLEKGQEISLNQLFLHGVNALGTIADYCRAELKTRAVGMDSMFSSGADPTVENYSVWNISPQGLVITFNDYQVAPYAAGPQTVIIPLQALKKIINPTGPLMTGQQ